MKRTLSLLLAILLLLPCIGTPVSATAYLQNLSTNYTLTGDPATDICRVAMAQEGLTGRQLGAVEHWCADFVFSCARAAGIGEDVIPANGSVAKLREGILNCGGYSVSTPQAGDLVFYTNAYGYCHVAIMTDSVYSMHGNLNGDPSSDSTFWNTSYVTRCKYTAYSNYTSYSFIRPNYSNAAPVDLGTDFYGIILNTAAWKPITVGSDSFVTMQTEIGHANQVWKFTRQSDGSYTIASALTGKLLEMHLGNTTAGNQVSAASFDWGGNYQRWYIYRLGSGYALQSKHYPELKLVLDMANNDSTNGTAVTTYPRNNTGAQIWSIYTHEDIQLKAPTLSVAAGSSSTDTVFTWNEIYGESGYQLSIWKNAADNSEPDYYAEDAKSGYSIPLPGGTYQATVTAVNYFESKTSSTVTFTVISDCTHTFGDWTVTTPVFCTEDGVQTHTCTNCGFSETQTISASGHNWCVLESIPATCQEPATVIYSCSKCASKQVEQDEIVWSDWSETCPDDLSENQLKTKTQYRYCDQESNWAQTESGTVEYAASWPSGFNTNNSLYTKYHNTPKTNSETDTQRVTVTSNEVIGYVYYHWCRGYAYGPINRRITDCNEGSFTYFHAFYSTSAGSDYDGNGSYGEGAKYYYNADCCKDSYWYLQIPVYRQSYTVQELQFSGERWTDWSAWSDAEITATDSRQVETRTLYRYVTEGLGEHSWVNGVCSLCSAAKPEAPFLMGDANDDGYVNNVDAMLVLQYTVGLNDGADLNVNACDVSGDGKINNVDAMMILQYAVGLITSFK